MKIQWQPGITLEDVEVAMIKAALKHFQGNKTKVANSLGITVRALYYKLERDTCNGLQDAAENAKPTKENKPKRATKKRDHTPHVKVTQKHKVPVSKRSKIQELSLGFTNFKFNIGREPDSDPQDTE